jgi:predicted ATPase
MKFTAKNLGIIESATVDFSGLTIILGDNNTGKSTLANAIAKSAWNNPINNIGDSKRNIDGTEQTYNMVGNDTKHCAIIYQDIGWDHTSTSNRDKNSVIVKNHRDIYDSFLTILGGEFLPTDNSQGSPLKTEFGVRDWDMLGIGTRKMFDLWVYLRYLANYNDLLIIDSPETFLSPRNQRTLARILVKLALNSIKICFTTQSDYMVKEISNLVMMHHAWYNITESLIEYDYTHDQTIPARMVNTYCMEVSDKAGRTSAIPMEVCPDLGIGADIFDAEIDELNAISDAIVWA